MCKDLISIIVPIYNVEKYLDKCIKSLINQSYSNIEIILIDDGSTDKSSLICDNYKKRDNRIVTIHKKNGGLSDARNVGIKVAKGKYITFVDSDDYVSLDYIEYLHELLIKYNVNIAFCGYSTFSENSNVMENTNVQKSKKCTKEEALEEILYARKFEVSACAKIFLLEDFKDVIFPVGKLFEDNATTYKLIEKNDFVALGYADKYFYLMRHGSITKTQFNQKHFDFITNTDQMCNDLEKYPSLKNAILRKKFVARISTLNRMINSTNRDKKTEKKLRKDILSYSSILKDKKSSIRDKAGYLLLKLGIGFYRFSWNLYSKIIERG